MALARIYQSHADKRRVASAAAKSWRKSVYAFFFWNRIEQLLANIVRNLICVIKVCPFRTCDRYPDAVTIFQRRKLRRNALADYVNDPGTCDDDSKSKPACLHETPQRTSITAFHT